MRRFVLAESLIFVAAIAAMSASGVSGLAHTQARTCRQPVHALSPPALPLRYPRGVTLHEVVHLGGDAHARSTWRQEWLRGRPRLIVTVERRASATTPLRLMGALGMSTRTACFTICPSGQRVWVYQLSDSRNGGSNTPAGAIFTGHSAWWLAGGIWVPSDFWATAPDRPRWAGGDDERSPATVSHSQGGSA
jgi:hypothetical protein